MAQSVRIADEMLETYQTSLPFHKGNRVYDILIANVTENGEPTGTFKPLIYVGTELIPHNVPRCATPDEAHFEALRYLRDAYRES